MTDEMLVFLVVVVVVSERERERVRKRESQFLSCDFGNRICVPNEVLAELIPCSRHVA